MKLMFAASLLALTLAACQPAQEAEPAVPETEAVDEAAAETPAAVEAADYSVSDNWLCLPSKAGSDACANDLSATVIDVKDGAVVTDVEYYEPASEPAIDCFYVYPTASTDPGGNSDLIADPAEEITVGAQFARFGEACRLYAPMYRQVTLAGLRARMAGQETDADAALAAADVKAAWDYYLENYNDGRGVVLVGHSQGSGVIRALLASDIIGTPAQDLVVSAMPTGITVPAGEDGTFNGMPPCDTASDTGCIIAYSSFRAESPPPASSFFGLNSPAGKALCVNPAMVSGDDGVLDAYLSTGPDMTGKAPVFAEGVEVETPFAKVPGLLTAECVSTDTHNYLAITANGDPSDARTDTFSGDVVIGGMVARDWGLHLIDMHVPMGNLVKIVKAQSAAWEASHSE